MLQVKNITMTHKKDLRVIVRDLSFVLNEKDRAVLIGEEGNGKSTLLKLIYDAALVEPYVEYTGQIMKGGLRLGFLPQELSMRDKRGTVYEYMCGEAAFLEADYGLLHKTLRMLRLDEELLYSERVLGTLSGGEKIKLAMTRLLLAQPQVLLLDEPSNDLDVETLEWLEDFLLHCGLPVLYISHDELLIERTATKVIHLEQLRRKTEPRHTVAELPYAVYAAERRAAMEKQAQLAQAERSEEAKQQERFRRIHDKVEHQQNIISRQDPHGAQLLKKKMKAVKALERRYEREKAEQTEFPETEEAMFITFSKETALPNGKRVLDFSLAELTVAAGKTDSATADGAASDKPRVLACNIMLRVIGPEKVGIIGQNGVGKTTLLRLLAKELCARKDIRAGYMPQEYEDLFAAQGGQIVTPLSFLTVTGDKEEQTRIRTYLGSMKYTADEMTHAVGALSGGQRAKLLLLKMSMAGCNVLILDEPTRNFSPLSAPVIRESLRAFSGAIISISHDRRYLAEVCDTVYRLTPEGLVRVVLQELL